jgi:hypothetical protein
MLRVALRISNALQKVAQVAQGKPSCEDGFRQNFRQKDFCLLPYGEFRQAWIVIAFSAVQRTSIAV